MEKLLKPTEVAEWLNLNVQTVYAMAQRNQLPNKKIGHAVRFSPKEIKAYLGLKES